MRICSLYGKIAQSKDNKITGTVLCALIRDNKIEGYICFDEREKEFFVRAENARARGGKMIFTTCGKIPANCRKLHFGLPVFSHLGELIGKLCDIEVTGGDIKYAVCGRKKIPTEKIILGGAAAIVGENYSAETCAKDMFISALTNRT